MSWKSILCVILVVLAMAQAFSYKISRPMQKMQVSRNKMGYSTLSIASSRVFMTMVDSSPEVLPGSPMVLELNKEAHTATIRLTLDGELTQRTFSKSLELFNEEVTKRQLKIPGFRKGAKLPPMYLYQIFGEEAVKGLCASLLSKDIQDECDKTGITTVGRGTILDFHAKDFTAGKPHTIDVKVELWPEITYSNTNGYKGLSVTVTKDPFDFDKYEKTKKSIQERYKDVQDTDSSYIAKEGDIAVVNMNGYEMKPDGSKGSALPSVAQGDSVEVVLEKGKYMEGLVEGIIGAKSGDMKTITVKFPRRPTGAGAALSGKEALFEVSVMSVKTKALPPWDENLANKIRDGMTLAELDGEVKAAIEGEKSKAVEAKRNDALATALVESAKFSHVPETLVDDSTQERFENMLMDFKSQGSTEEQIKEMATPENFNKYKEISRPTTEKVVKLGLLFRDISEKESIKVSEAEIKQQLDILLAQSKQKNQGMPDESQAREEIENTLLRLKVFDFIASHSQVTYVDAPAEATA